MKRYLMLILLGLFTFGAAVTTTGCRAEVEPEDDVDLKVDVD
jgi:hypothetical protein